MNRHPNFDNILQSLHNRYIFYVHYIFNVSVYYFLQKYINPTISLMQIVMSLALGIKNSILMAP